MSEPQLSAGDWAVLGLIAEGPTHGFAVAQLLGPGGELGRVWTLPRPVVYQALHKLVERHLVAEGATVRSGRGPARTMVSVTAAGREALDTWLAQPVDHVRDVRSLLLLKLALLDRAGRSAEPLLAAQQEVLEPVIGNLRQLQDRAEGFEWTLATWRLESSETALRLVTAVRQRARDLRHA